jgi:hypothetical protein
MSVQQAALRMADSAAGALGVFRRWLDPDDLLRRASRRAGLDDFGTDTLHEPLQRFLSACTAEADLNIVGHFATRWDTLRLLSNLLRLRAEEVIAPDILEEPIEKPIFITGVPRSGTSFLHDLMLRDRGTRAPRVWQTIYPYPIARGRDIRLDRVRRQIRAFGRLAPEFQARHPLDAVSPQECTEITAHVFRSLRFDTTHWIPSYREWLDATGHLDAYRFHRRFLQHLQRQDGPGQWVLKSPDHVFALEAVRAVYPDARVIFLHRNPLDVLASNARLTEVLRAPFARRANRPQIGRQESARWRKGTTLMMEAAATDRFAEPILHLRYSDLAADPAATVQRIYQHFGMAPSSLVLDAATSGSRSRYAAKPYRLEEFGLDPAAEAAAFAPYIDRFAVAA